MSLHDCMFCIGQGYYEPDADSSENQDECAECDGKGVVSWCQCSALCNADCICGYVCPYELDDGPLTDAKIAAIRAASPATSIPRELFKRGLFK